MPHRKHGNVLSGYENLLSLTIDMVALGSWLTNKWRVTTEARTVVKPRVCANEMFQVKASSSYATPEAQVRRVGDVGRV